MPADKEEAIGVRVPATWKKAIQELAAQRFTSESAIAREAMLEYLERRGITAAQLREQPRSDKPSTRTRFPEHKETAHTLNDTPTHAATKGTGNTVAKAATKLVKSKRQATQTHSPKP